MAGVVKKDMIIKLNLPDEHLQRLLDISERSQLSLSQIFEYFIEDLIHDDHCGSLCIEDWLYARTGHREKSEEMDFEDDLPVTFTKNQVEIMNLLDLILEN